MDVILIENSNFIHAFSSLEKANKFISSCPAIVKNDIKIYLYKIDTISDYSEIKHLDN